MSVDAHYGFLVGTLALTLLEKLQELHTNGPAPYNHGICTQLTGLTNQERGYMLHLMHLWPGSSGHPDYPVPANRTSKCHKTAQHKYMVSNTEQMWGKGQEYGQLRWELLEWLIEELQK